MDYEVGKQFEEIILRLIELEKKVLPSKFKKAKPKEPVVKMQPKSEDDEGYVNITAPEDIDV